MLLFNWTGTGGTAARSRRSAVSLYTALFSAYSPARPLVWALCVFYLTKSSLTHKINKRYGLKCFLVSHARPSTLERQGRRPGFQVGGPGGLVVGFSFRRLGITFWKARHSTFSTGRLRANTDEVSSSTFRATVEPHPCVRRLTHDSPRRSWLRRGPQLQPPMAHARYERGGRALRAATH